MEKRFNRRRGPRGHSGQGYRQEGGRPDHHRGNRGFRRRPGFDTGNQRERIAVESGSLVMIDQFMLANPEFVEAYAEIVDEPLAKKVSLIQRFGGLVVDVAPGTYRIDRDPYRYSIVIHPEHIQGADASIEDGEAAGTLYINTRCLAMIDRELLDDTSLLEKYQHLWFGGKDKACRDLLRDNGGAVRYGFSRYSDDLSVRLDRRDNLLVLAPENPIEHVAN